MESYKFDISDITTEKGASKDIWDNFKIGKVTLRGQEADVGVVNFKGTVENVEEGVVLKARAKGTLILTCSRCLDKFKYPLDIEVNEFYAFEDTEAEHLVENNAIDLSSVIIEALALNLDIKILCKEDCAGLCPSCGASLNRESCDCKDQGIDIRWHKLQDLKKRLSEGK